MQDNQKFLFAYIGAGIGVIIGFVSNHFYLIGIPIALVLAVVGCILDIAEDEKRKAEIRQKEQKDIDSQKQIEAKNEGAIKFYKEVKRRNISDFRNNTESNKIFMMLASQYYFSDYTSALSAYSLGQQLCGSSERTKELAEVGEAFSKCRIIGKAKYVSLIEQGYKSSEQIYWINRINSETSVRLAPTQENADLGGMLGAGLTGSALGGAYVYEKTNQANAARRSAYENSLRESEEIKRSAYSSMSKEQREMEKYKKILDGFQRKLYDENNATEKLKKLRFDAPKMTLTDGGNIR